MTVVWSFVRNFTRDEFACPCCGREEMRHEFLTRLSSARAMAGIPFVVTSGWRCLEHDLSLNGGGEHVLGCAVNIACRNSHDRWLIIDNLIIAGFRRIGVAPGFIHAGSATLEDGYDPDVLWLYPMKEKKNGLAVEPPKRGRLGYTGA